jgi:lysyl-tRNA synthetase class 2
MRFFAKCEGNYIQPTFITDYPKEMSPCVKSTETIQNWQNVLSWWFVVANAYSEWMIHWSKSRFEEQMRLSEKEMMKQLE